MTFQSVIQGLCLAAFMLLLWLTAFPMISPVTVDAFLVLDPVIIIGTAISGRTWVPAFGAGVLILLITPLMGRFFCGCLCPMGTTVDIMDRILPAEKKVKPATPALGRLKLFLLFFILGGSILGISFVFLASPLSLITRFYGLILHPMLCHAGGITLATLRPIMEKFDIPVIAYWHTAMPQYHYQWVTVLLFFGIYAGSRFSPRFWCRYLCPAGAAFSLLSPSPIVRRQVNDQCSECGLCRKRCPMGAISENPIITRHGECIACETCVRVCPEHAVSFNASRPEISAPLPGFSIERRQWLRAVLTGVGAAVITRSDLSYPFSNAGTGLVPPTDLIRPPGARPEIDFLSRCIRCGACMKACPTNTLQPLGLDAGAAAFSSPKVIPRRGPCDPACNACGQVCPTGAIHALSLDEKRWAKIGTAQILRHRCLAWEYDKKCLVCDEVCPYDAISLKRVEGIRDVVPFVDETRCAGCGFCEHHCPVQHQAAIEVSPMAAFRLSSGSYRKTGMVLGFSLNLRQNQVTAPVMEPAGDGLPPGFTP